MRIRLLGSLEAGRVVKRRSPPAIAGVPGSKGCLFRTLTLLEGRDNVIKLDVRLLILGIDTMKLSRTSLH